MSASAKPADIPGEAAAFAVTAFVVVGLTLVRLVGLRASTVELFFDESQYWSWSRELAFGYFSKPPLLAWLIAAAGEVCGSTEACIRAPAPLLYGGASLLSYGIGRTLYDARTGFWAAMLTALGTGTVFSARIISTDVPLVLFWSLALFAYVRMLRRPGWRWAIALGFAIGAGLLAKYAMIYFVIGMALAAALEPGVRLMVRGPRLWLVLAVAALAVAPNMVWNIGHGFLSLRHAGGNVIGEEIVPSALRPLEFLGAQFAVFGPVVFGVALTAMPLLRSAQFTSSDRILLAFAIPPLAVVTVAAMFVHAYANWAAASFISLAVLAAAILVRRDLSILLWASLGLGVLVQGALIGADAVAARIRIPLLASPTPYERTLGWKAYALSVGALARQHGLAVIVGDRRSDVASLLYYWRDQPEQILAWPTADLPTFELTRGLTAASAPVLFVSECPLADRLEKFYAMVELLGIVRPDDAISRPFAAFRLDAPRGPIGPLGECRWTDAPR